MIKWIKQKYSARKQRIEHQIILKYLGKPASPEEQKKQQEAMEQAKRELRIIQVEYDPVTENFSVKGIQNVRTLAAQLMLVSMAEKTLTAHFNKMIIQRQDSKIILPR